MSDISSFSIQNQRQIISHLFLLFKNKCLLNARFGATNESYITTLLRINEENNTVVLDCGPNEYLNRHILNASKVNFETQYRGIKVSFTGTALKKTTHEGDQALIMPIPKTLFWMERREYYRVKIPILKPSYCQLILEDREAIDIKLHDISLSGFSMLDDYKEILNLMNSGTSFEQCKLILSEVGEDMISFEVRYKYIVNPDKSQKIQKIGCKFIKITRSFENSIQNYMQRIQREDLQDSTQNPEKTTHYRKILVYINDQ